MFSVTGVTSPAVFTLPQYSLADRHYLRFLLDNEYMDRRNITCLLSFIINVTKQNLLCHHARFREKRVQHGHSRQAQISVQVKQLPGQSNTGKLSRGDGQARKARVNTGGDRYRRKGRSWEFLKGGKQEK